MIIGQEEGDASPAYQLPSRAGVSARQEYKHTQKHVSLTS